MSEGFVQMVQACVNCGRLFAFNPLLVPSVRVNGKRQPICGPCMDSFNAKRRASGLDPVHIHPEAYEACKEEDLPY